MDEAQFVRSAKTRRGAVAGGARPLAADVRRPVAGRGTGRRLRLRQTRPHARPGRRAHGKQPLKPASIGGIAAAALYAAVFAYGYWHAATHATFEVQLVYRTETGVVNKMRNGQIEFLDGEGGVLARASIDTRQNVVWLAHPDRGQCGPGVKGEDYKDCVKTQAEWIPLWARHVRHANIALERCSLARRPVGIDSRRDGLALWWLTWLRPPPTGSQPYTRYSAKIALDTRGCQ
jgi:hypothetical protein